MGSAENLDPKPGPSEIIGLDDPRSPETESTETTPARDLGGREPGAFSATVPIHVLCGPLLNYRHLATSPDRAPVWHGSVLIVATPSARVPRLELRLIGPIKDNGNVPEGDGGQSAIPPIGVDGTKLYADRQKAFWRFSIEAPLERFEMKWEYSILDFEDHHDRSDTTSWNFVVPSIEQSMRIMFHSCNGFSVGTDMNRWQGPLLWHDVLRLHEERPFHVMIGGGDQIYNDSVRVEGPLRAWTDIGNPTKRRNHRFPSTMREECDSFYFNNYIRWFCTEPFSLASAQIPQINIWDDHDIIDGFGSYTDHFMKCPVFRGIGGVAYKYYCLFQHHTAPPKSTYTTDSPATMQAVCGTSGEDPGQLQLTYVHTETTNDPSWIIGAKPGPYVEESSRSICTRLGKRIAFIGIDGRTERTRHQVNYPETYNLIFERLETELKGSNGDIKHLIVLLGVPIAYPRLAWLENILSSPIIAPIRFMNRRFGLAGSLFNKFDGQVDLLDDLDDHYTARQHKEERRILVQRLQAIAERHSVRVTFLGGDVHLAAIGRFYSRPKKKIPSTHDPKYMVNVISSAITNKPPPKAVANLLAHRNKIHHLDKHTDETLMDIFDYQPGPEGKVTDNKVTMPSRNYACITEVVHPASGPNTSKTEEFAEFQLPKNGHFPLHAGEVGAGVRHAAADGVTALAGVQGSLDVSIRVEIDPVDVTGAARGYGFYIPPLAKSQAAK
ncbi:hypothetical protein LOZ12_000601 [Ophidiomyces ophidiicola]|uniref:Uncharacterized protein n=1 Tax=Ophidiomyces ophidiicola TaxID=1387563 RepID=A0ACB8V1B1_9EURO|nr:uncharacterized protein LOZ57_000044 [Ophidiomyces ophidiicola]KAI1922232.1 hypothetical protein LOZ64_001345 [Ophidiomyces ophidiicola]KAI1942251.1 hypothetical protein LOZ62_004631 [Ophidiomyces ophidiicola]KAI1953703.1 hypothetical protein LOZ57_000044 [Ophidiomyces ophidiicola]KAI2011074.1 hypothetical protein LOZ50_000869 [Ophidiomyces ophidiicola]KAI2031355.1 hypothetical protein LOZ45_001418 [Ophidiomyces ophidiicola]